MYSNINRIHAYMSLCTTFHLLKKELIHIVGADATGGAVRDKRFRSQRLCQTYTGARHEVSRRGAEGGGGATGLGTEQRLLHCM